MTTQPPPPPGGYPPPAGGYPPGGYPPSPQGTGYPAPPQWGPARSASPGDQRHPPPAALPTAAYTSWFTRVVAWLLDYVPFMVILSVGWALLLGTSETECAENISEYDFAALCTTGASSFGQLSISIAFILGLVYWVWNLGYRQGTTGSSIGKSIMKFRLVNEKTGKPMGFGLSLVREILYLLALFGFGILWLIAVLFPLWDAKRQTLADKVMSTVCLPR